MRSPLGRRTAFVAGALLVLLLAWQLGISPAIGRLRDMERAVSKAKSNVATMRALSDELAELERAHPGHPSGSSAAGGQELVSSVEECIRRSGVAAELSYRPEGAEQGASGPAAPRVAVVIKSVDLSRLVGIIHEIESSPRGFRVNGLRVRWSGSEGSQLRAEFEVSTFL